MNFWREYFQGEWDTTVVKGVESGFDGQEQRESGSANNTLPKTVWSCLPRRMEVTTTTLLRDMTRNSGRGKRYSSWPMAAI